MTDQRAQSPPTSEQSETPSTACSSQSTVPSVLHQDLDIDCWKFPSDDIARMLSPKTLKPEYATNPPPSPTIPYLSQHIFDIDQRREKQPLDPPPCNIAGIETSDAQKDLIQWLNVCLASIRSTDGSASGWWKDLRFVSRERQLSEGEQPTSPSKPTQAGVNCPVDVSDVEFTWSGSNDGNQYRIEIPVEVNHDLHDLLSQSVAYAESLFGFCPIRAFVVVLGLHLDSNEDRRDLYFFIFHHSGTTTNEPADLHSEQGRIASMHMLRSMMMWSRPEHAGFPSFTDGHEVLLPSIGGQTRWKVLEELYSSPSVQGQGTWVLKLEALDPDSHSDDSDTFSEDVNPPSLCASSGPFYHSHTLSDDAGGQFVSTESTNAGTPVGASHDANSSEISSPPVRHLQESPRALRLALPYEAVLKCSWPIEEKKDTETEMYLASHGLFGTPQLLGALFAENPDSREAARNVPLTPPDTEEEQIKLWCSILQQESSSDNDEALPEHRSFAVALLKEETQGLDTCEDPWDLCESLMHGLLARLLAPGCEHRECPEVYSTATRQKFSATGVTTVIRSLKGFDISELGDVNDVFEPEDMRRASLLAADDLQMRILVDKATAVQDLANQLEVGTTCVAAIYSGDRAAALFDMTYFDQQPEDGTSSSLSGTPEFMSRMLRKAVERGTPYFHTPLDDLFSFFWIALSALLHSFNVILRGNKDETIWRGRLKTTLSDRDSVCADLIDSLPIITHQMGGHSPMVEAMVPLLLEWNSALTVLQRHWNTFRLQKPSPHESACWFYLSAYEGVETFLRLVLKHRKHVQSFSPQNRSAA